MDVPSSPLVLVQSLSPVAAPLAVLAMAGAALSGRRTARIALAGTSVAVLAAQAAIWAPWLTGEPVGRGQDLTVMSVNLYKGHADTTAIVRIARAEGVDVLAVSELTPAAAASLDARGIDDLLPNAIPRERGSSTTTALFSRLAVVPPTNAAPGSLAAAARGQTAMLPDAAGVIVGAVHPTPPVPGRVRAWRMAQDEMTDWAAHVRGPIVVAGDFNASVDHPGMRQLMSTGLRDSHEVVGARRPVTWPIGRTLPPFVQIDHVLVRGVDVESADDVHVPGSDHDAVIARLVIPAGR